MVSRTGLFTAPLSGNPQGGAVTFGAGTITTASAHGFIVGQGLTFLGVTGSPGVSSGVIYFVLTVPTSTTMTVSATLGGSTITITAGAATGVAPITAPQGTSPNDGRRVLGALVGTTFGVLSGGGIAQSGTVMQFTVAQTVWAVPDPTDSANIFLSPSDSIVLTGSAGPGSGSRIDSVGTKQNNVENGDSDSRIQVAYFAGTASGSPVAPTLPSGYSRYANIAVPTSAANAAACTVTILAPQATIALSPAAITGTLTPTGTFSGAAGYTTKLEKNGNIVTLAFALTNSAATSTASIPSGASMATLPAGFRPTSNPVTSFVGYNNSGAILITYTIDTAGVIRVYPQSGLGGTAILYGSVSFSVA